MTLFRSLVHRIGMVLDLFDAAVAASAALRGHRVPAARDLRRLGISADKAALQAMARA